MLSLVDLCLLSLRNSIENGNCQNLHLLPVELRQQIWDTILMHGTMDNPNCFQQLTSSEFLSDLKSLNSQGGNKCDDKYLNRVSSQIPLDNCITKLQLNLYRCLIENKTEETNLRGVLNLISRCPSLISLDIRTHDKLVEAKGENKIAWNKPEALESVKSVLENLNEISLIGTFSDYYPVLNFRNLTSLKLERGDIVISAWWQLLDSLEDTLTYLNLDNVVVKDDFGNDISYKSDILMRRPLPQLKYFKFNGVVGIRCTKLFFQNLTQCTKLEYVFLHLNYGTIFASSENWFNEDETWLKALNQIEARLEIKISVEWSDDTPDDVIFDEFSRFKLVGLFKEKITELEFSPEDKWSPRFTSAYENMVDVCTNLESFEFSCPNCEDQNEDEDEEEQIWLGRESVNRALYRFFSDPRKILGASRSRAFSFGVGGLRKCGRYRFDTDFVQQRPTIEEIQRLWIENREDVSSVN